VATSTKAAQRSRPPFRDGQITDEPIPRRALGTTGESVSAIGLGGWHLGLVGTERECTRLVHAAVDAGITFVDNAWEYHDGKSEERVGKALADRRDEVFLMSKVCTHGRDATVAMRQLHDSLRRLKTDYLDLWQVHEVAYYNDPERTFGFTGHKDPGLHLRMLSYNYPFDAVQLPLNCCDASFRSFEEAVLPELLRRGIGPIGMKSMGGEGDMVKKKAVTAQEALAYAMSLPVATTVCGIESMRVLNQNVRVARGFTPLTAGEMQWVRSRVAGVAADGRFELYKTTAKHEANVGRKQHGFPPQGEA